MNREQLIEDELLIARFVNYELTVNGHRYFTMDIDDLTVYNSWDFIFAVIEKIESINGGAYSVSIHKTACIITDTGLRGNVKLNEMCTIVKVTSVPIKKIAVWRAIVRFIKWWNDIKKEEYEKKTN